MMNCFLTLGGRAVPAPIPPIGSTLATDCGGTHLSTVPDSVTSTRRRVGGENTAWARA